MAADKTTLFERYVVESELGAGGMGKVFLATDSRLGRRVALKVLLASRAGSEGGAQWNARMVREARAAAAFRHPNAVVVYDVGEADGQPYIAMEYVSGKPMRAYVKDSTTPWQRKLGWLVQVAGALAAAHKAGIVHRDIKPDNVIIGEDGHARVVDFGIARRPTLAVQANAETIDAGLPTLTAAGEIIGTPAYMAPEQIQSGPLDGRTDQFAWGVMAYELLAGRIPWDANDALQVIGQILTANPPRLRERAPDVPAAVEAAIMRTLEKPPAARFPSLDEVEELLLPFVESRTPLPGATTTSAVRVPATAAVTAKAPRWKKAIVAAGAVAIAAVAAFVFWPTSPVNPLHGAHLDDAPRLAASAPAALRMVAPADSASLTARNRVARLQWEDPSGDRGPGTEVAIERVSPEPHGLPSKEVPAGLDYLMIPWDSIAARPGQYRWRIRTKGTGAWSEWRSFSYQPDQLAAIKASGTIRYGIERVQHEPFVMWDADQRRFRGFDVELGEKIAATLGVKSVLLPQSWGELLSAKLPGEYDAVISAVSITPERCETKGFSKPYLFTGQRLARIGNKPTGPNDTFVLGVQRNTTSETLARARFKKANLQLVDTNDQVFAMLVERKIDALVCDDVLIHARPEMRPDAGSGWKADGAMLSHEAYGILFSKEEPELIAEVNRILDTLRTEGFLSSLMQKHGIHESPPQKGLGCAGE